MNTLALALLRTDGGTQPRAELSEAVIAEYTADLRNGAEFPPVVVFYDGADYWLADGFHRLHAALRCDRSTIEVDVRPGTLAEAQWYSYSVNQSHGLRRTNEDKRRAVVAALAHEFAGRYSSSQIAHHVGVSHTFVDNLRPILQRLQDDRIVTRNGSTYTMHTAKIGKSAEPGPFVRRSTLPVEYVAELKARDSEEWAIPEDTATPRLAPLSFTRVHQLQAPAAPITSVDESIKIIHGDARQAHALPGVHLVITSPPYNVDLAYGTHDDNLTSADYRNLLLDVFANCYRAMVDGARIAVVVPFGVGRNPWLPLASRVQAWLSEAGFTLRGQIVWDKGTTGNRTSWGSFRMPSDPSLRDTTEAIVIAHKGESRLELPANALQHDVKGTFSPWLASADDFMALAQDHWQIAPESAQRIGHPAPFPVALAEQLIRFYGYPGCHVLDPFGGSGTVGVAARKLGCQATLIDIDAAYCALAAARCAEVQDA